MDPLDADFIYEKPVTMRRRICDQHKRISVWSQSLPNLPLDEMVRLHDVWQTTFIADYSQFCVINKFDRCSLAMYIFVELARTNYQIMDSTKLRLERDIITNLGPDPDTMLSVYAPWDPMLPIMAMSLDDCIGIGLKLQTEMINHACTSDWFDFTMRTTALYTRVGQLIADDTPKDKLMCLTIYFNAIQRRIYYGNVIQQCPPYAGFDAPTVEHWFVNEVCPAVCDSYRDIYMNACDDAYNFPGDEEYFRYMFPGQDSYRGSILSCCRKAYAKTFYMEKDVSMESVLGLVNAPSQAGHCARTFVLYAVNYYLLSMFGCEWMGAVVIDNAQLENVANQHKLLKDKAPLLLQVQSRYWLYFKARVYCSDNIYETLGGWFHLLATQFKGILFDTFDLSDVIRDWKPRVLPQRR
jgi:hypothetical protein